MPLPTTLRALKHRDFQLFFSGQLISLIGTWMQNVAQSWLVYRLTGSPELLGLVGFAGQIPVFFLAPLGGAAADHYNRHRIVIATQAASMVLALALAALTLSGHVRISHVLVLAALLGVVNSFDIPARQAFITNMVGKTDLMNAIALNSAMFNASRIVGPAVAGILVAAIGEGWCFFANGVSYIAVIIGLLLMPRLGSRAGTAGRPNEAARFAGAGSAEGTARARPALAAIVEGFRFVAKTSPIHAILILLGVVSITGMPYAVLMPIFSKNILHGGARELGMLMGATGVGALAGALLLATRRSVSGLGRWVWMSAGGFGVMLILFALSRSFWLSFALMIPTGFTMMVEMGSSNTLIQMMSPDHLRGRVMSAYSMMFMGMAPVGALLAGLAAGRFGAPFTVAAGGAFCAAAATGFALWLPHLRPEARRLIVAQQMAGGDPPQEMVGGNIPLED